MTVRRDHLIADDASAAVRAAQDALNEQVRRGALTNDPLRHYLEAMSIGLGAMHKMFVDGTLTIASAVEAAKQNPHHLWSCQRAKEGATSSMNRAISSFTWAWGFKPTLK